jgi:hypothetical protein
LSRAHWFLGSQIKQYLNLTDGELWRAIAENTVAMSLLVQKQLELDSYVGAKDPVHRGRLMRIHVERANMYQREYQEYAAELRRRYP